jgi:DNA-directed RNA polymerase specialized sigma24 family protein
MAGDSKQNQADAESAQSFAAFVRDSEVKLLKALVAHHGPDIGRDALADAYVYAWKNWARIRVADNLVGYVFRAADRIGANRTMKANREQPHVAATLDAPWLDHDPHPEVAVALRQLPARQRGAVLLVHGYGYSYKEAAEILDLPLSTLTNDATRGLQQLRRQDKS